MPILSNAEVLLRFHVIRHSTCATVFNRLALWLLSCLRSMVMLRLLCDRHAPTVYQEPILTDNKTINLLQFLDLLVPPRPKSSGEIDLQEKPKWLLNN
jgi:hypothetical protein